MQQRQVETSNSKLDIIEQAYYLGGNNVHVYNITDNQYEFVALPS